MIGLVCLAIGENVLEEKTVAVLETRFAVLGVAPAALAGFHGAADTD